MKFALRWCNYKAIDNISDGIYLCLTATFSNIEIVHLASCFQNQ